MDVSVEIPINIPKAKAILDFETFKRLGVAIYHTGKACFLSNHILSTINKHKNDAYMNKKKHNFNKNNNNSNNLWEKT